MQAIRGVCVDRGFGLGIEMGGGIGVLLEQKMLGSFIEEEVVEVEGVRP